MPEPGLLYSVPVRLLCRTWGCSTACSRSPALARQSRPFVALLASLASVAQAQYLDLDYGGFEALFEEPVTLSVTGAPLRESAVPVSMEIVTAEDIRRSGARDIPGVLRHVTGVDVKNWTVNGSDLSIRGYNKAMSSRLLVLVNGRQIYAEHYGFTPWSGVPVELGEIRQIEVVKGPNSALFGFNASGGVINIVTYSPRYDDIRFLSVRAGTQDLREGSTAGTVRWTDGGLRVSAGWRENANFDTPEHPSARGIRQGDRRENLRLDLHATLAEGLTAEVEASATQGKQIYVPLTYIPSLEDSSVHSIKGLLAAETDWGLVQGSLYSNWLESDAYQNLSDDAVYQPGQPPMLTFKNRLTVGLLETLFKPGADHSLRMALEWRDSVMDTTPVRGGEAGYTLRAAAATWHWQALPELTLTTALRHDLLSLERSGFTPRFYPLSNADWDRDIRETSVNLGLVWEAGARDTLRLNAARGAQLPNLYDLGGSLFEIPLPPELGLPPMYNSGVPTLEPTTVTHFELGWRHRFLSGLELDLALFRDQARDVIATFGEPDFLLGIGNKPANIGDSYSHGLEARLKGRRGEAWRWALGLLLQHVEDEFGAYSRDLTLTDFEGSTPEYVLDAALGWSGAAWDADVFVRHVAPIRGIRNSNAYFELLSFPSLLPPVEAAVDAYTAVDARVARRYGERLELSLNGRNLLHAEQEQTAGSAIERQIFLSIDYRF